MPIPIHLLETHVIHECVKQIRNAQYELQQQCVETSPEIEINFQVQVVIEGGLNAINRTTENSGSTRQTTVNDGEEVTVAESDESVVLRTSHSPRVVDRQESKQKTENSERIEEIESNDVNTSGVSNEHSESTQTQSVDDVGVTTNGKTSDTETTYEQ